MLGCTLTALAVGACSTFPLVDGLLEMVQEVTLTGDEQAEEMADANKFQWKYSLPNGFGQPQMEEGTKTPENILFICIH